MYRFPGGLIKVISLTDQDDPLIYTTDYYPTDYLLLLYRARAKRRR